MSTAQSLWPRCSMFDIDVNKLAALANNADANAVARFAKANLAEPFEGGFETFKGDAAGTQIGNRIVAKAGRGHHR